MKTLMVGMVLLTMFSGGVLLGQDIAGTWQGTLQAGKDLRTVAKISKADNGSWEVEFYSIDQGGQRMNASAATLEGSTFKFSIAGIGASFEGKLSADRTTMVGTWTQGPKSLPLTLTRANADTAWEIPKPLGPMDPNVSPQFEVATVKPSDPNVAGHWITFRGRQFSTHDWSLDDLIEFAYEVQIRQIIGGPDWLDKDKFDISGEADHEGMPNPKQLRTMLQKLLADRFRLTLHHDKKELPVYVLAVAKNGAKLNKNENGGALPGLFFRPASGGITLAVMNGTMSDFTTVMQAGVLDRPVVDQTGLVDKYDFQLTWAPDGSQFTGSMHLPPPSQSDNPPPSLYTAIQEQLGLKLEATKAPADVLVIDRAEKPSAN